MAESSEENRAASIEIVNDPIRDDDVESVQEAITHEDPVFKHLHYDCLQMLHGLNHIQLRRLRTLLSLWPLLDLVDYEIEDVRNFDPLLIGQV
jgi:hypothetical protein